MKFARKCGVAIFAAGLVLGLSACDRSDSPSKKIERAAEDAIGELKGEDLPPVPVGRFAPRDECLDQPGASEFLGSLDSAVQARDEQAFLALVADDVILDFGGGSGKALLRERLKDDDLALWDELNELMTLGCASDGARITMPWYFAQDFPSTPGAVAIVTGESVPLLEVPEDTTEPLAQISWDMVEVSFEDTAQHENFAKVSWNDGKAGTRPYEGYIAKDRLRYLIDYRVIAARRNDRWSITNFIAGD
ncbi:hypothetical protein CP97_11135 [Aurantiacibacter atlanticus]|uniref:Lipoprotein n=1 Tax=Aurantiacibacter atlanticus TaxID=1648404 RepID=A0A0H4VZ50_9SPHN|nr:hypothetical protein [Aurantiacibacter atlanticus]AKQ42463.1 hypothetical protein CP97_11135 [Aurantiacibacter atlanticus]MDF1834678.1 hypothetical protein [Alteraurantiacibacter sp. bin_em_oilr2.035]